MQNTHYFHLQVRKSKESKPLSTVVTQLLNDRGGFLLNVARVAHRMLSLMFR